MRTYSRLRGWLLAVFNRTRMEDDMDAEMRAHMEAYTRDLMRKGLSSDEALRRSRLEFGSIETAKDGCRESSGLRFWDELGADIRFGARMLRKNPGFTAVAVLTLALAIGANSAIFSVVNAVLLRPLPFADSDKLMMVWATDSRRGVSQDVASYPDFLDWRAQSKSFAGLAAFRNATLIVSGGTESELARGLRVSPGFFEILKVQPSLGRSFRAGEEELGSSQVAILSDGFWKRHFGGALDAVGKTIRLTAMQDQQAETYTIVGVMPEDFRFSTDEAEDIYIPLVGDPNRNHGWLPVIGRLRSNVPTLQAQAELDLIGQQLAKQYPKSNRDTGVNVQPMLEALVGKLRAALMIFVGVVAAVLLIGCSNVANLMLARSAVRRKELAVRAAIGASRGRLMRQLLTESVLLALFGGALALLLAAWISHGLVALLGKNFSIPRIANTHIDPWVLAFTLALSVTTGIVFGVVPAMTSAAHDLNDDLREASRGATGSTRVRRWRWLLVVGETALALVLLACAGLLLQGLMALRGTSPGFDRSNLLTVNLSLPKSKFEQLDSRVSYMSALLSRIQALPEIGSAALVADLPLGGSPDSLAFHIIGQPEPTTGKDFRVAEFNIASPGYFHTMEIPMLSGREFGSEDTASTPRVAVINKTAARRFWPDEDPVGKQIWSEQDPITKQPIPLTIVGVAGDVRQTGLGRPSRAEIYLDYLQPVPDWYWSVLVVRTASDPMRLADAVKNAASSVDPDVPLQQMRSMEEVLSTSIARERVSTLLLGIFAALALALAAIGLYGVVSYSVAQRTTEMGVRMALGATRADVLRLVLRQGLRLGLSGLLIGLVSAAMVTRLLTHLMENVHPYDPIALSVVSAGLMAVVLFASYVPARRATRINPISALRHE